jgi:hypothetical protein
MKKDKKKDKPANKTPELSKAKKALDAYLKENNLDPQKDWSKDKKHGKKVTELLNKLNKERDKVAAQYPEKDLKNEAKLVKMKKKAEEEKASKKEKKEKKESAGSRVTKYDYPLIDGREMTSDEKKKYRMEQRKLAAGKAPKEKKETKEVSKKVKEDAEKAAPAKKDKKADKKKDKKKKAKKEED